MPIALLRVFLAQVPRLSAEESLLESQRVSVGSGTLKAHDSREIRRAWRKAAERRSRRVVERVAPSPEAFAEMGMGLRVIDKKKANGD